MAADPARSDSALPVGAAELLAAIMLIGLHGFIAGRLSEVARHLAETVKQLLRRLPWTASGLKGRHLPGRARRDLTVRVADLAHGADGAPIERLAGAGATQGSTSCASALVPDGMSATAASSSGKRASCPPTEMRMC